jgi:primase-polymerase (primpol)-like protein
MAISPSGTGSKLFGRKLPPGRKKGKVEMYDTGRFFSHGAAHRRNAVPLCDRQKKLNNSMRNFWKTKLSEMEMAS